MNHTFKRGILLGALLTAVLGTLLHFTYEWCGRNPIIGLFVPVSESTWEHTKMLFFPMLLSSCFLYAVFHRQYPGILSGLLSGILTGCVLIPVFFYTYTGILGYHTLLLDIITFLISIMAAFRTAYRLTKNNRAKPFTPLLLILLGLLFLAYLGFSYFPPALGIFRQP